MRVHESDAPPHVMPRFTKTDGTIPRDVNTQLPLSEHPSQLFYTQSGPKAPHEGETEPALVDASLTYSTDHHCIASRMNSDSEIESESSLPTRPAPIFPSSPPAIQRTEASFGNIEEMDNAPHFKSEPPATQIDEASKPPLRRVSSDETERPPSAQQAQGDAHDHVHESDEEDEEELDSDPAETIADFDWDALHERYHNAMNGCHEQEGELAQEWESLMNV